MDERKRLGNQGEEAVARWLRREGYQLLASQYRCRFGEIDIVAQKSGYLVFCEVKTRTSEAFARAQDAVDARKRERLRKTAQLYLMQHPTRLQPRFDVLEVLVRERDGLLELSELRHLENAFE